MIIRWIHSNWVRSHFKLCRVLYKPKPLALSTPLKSKNKHLSGRFRRLSLFASHTLGIQLLQALIDLELISTRQAVRFSWPRTSFWSCGLSGHSFSMWHRSHCWQNPQATKCSTSDISTCSTSCTDLQANFPHRAPSPLPPMFKYKSNLQIKQHKNAFKHYESQFQFKQHTLLYIIYNQRSQKRKFTS